MKIIEVINFCFLDNILYFNINHIYEFKFLKIEESALSLFFQMTTSRNNKCIKIFSVNFSNFFFL